jgi:hypothetical protein
MMMNFIAAVKKAMTGMRRKLMSRSKHRHQHYQHQPVKHVVPALHNLLTYRRAHNSVGEKQYIHDFILPLAPRIIATPDNEVMAFIVYVGESRIMFTSHTDSVHLNVDKVHQDIVVTSTLYSKNDNQPLGADDAAGNWLMFNMIDAKIPGVYAFFRGEERGGIGSSWCAKNRKDLFENIDCAIAFDRRGKDSIITHQGRGRGCSDEFGLSLAQAIGLGYKLDDTGIYTDTAEFFGLVRNCTNVSVGYEHEHSKKEILCRVHIEKLRDRLLQVDWSTLDHTAPKPDPIPVHRTFTGFGTPQRLFDVAIDSFGHDDEDMLYPKAPRDWADEPLYPVSDTDFDAIQLADILFENCDVLPDDLRNEALMLSQEIYKRFE